MRPVALVVRFLLELALLLGVVLLVRQIVPGAWGWILAILAAVAVAVIWGLFLSPKATVPLPPAAALALEGLLFAGTGLGLFAVGFALPAILGVAIWIVDRAVLGVTGRPQRDSAGDSTTAGRKSPK